MTDSCAAAKALAARNFRVFPLQPNSKLPAIRSWPSAASDDVHEIERMFQNSLDANIGIATGREILVLDFDTKGGAQGLQSRFVLEALGLPDTLEATTPSGGVHLYFNVDAVLQIGNSVGRILPGVDVRAHHGYVVAPPSCIDGRNYKWVDTERQIADAPDWLVQMCMDAKFQRQIDADEPLGPIDTPEAIQRGVEWLQQSAPIAQEGDHGDLTTFKVAATLKDFGIGIDSAHRLMLEHWNDSKAVPPWDVDDLAAKVESAFHSGRNRPGSANAAAQFGAVDLLEGAKGSGEAGAPKRRMYGADLDDLAERALSGEGHPLVKGLLNQHQMSVIYGQSNTGKTFVALDIAWHIATGTPWNGRKVEHGLVVYLAAEGGMGIAKRAAALRQTRGSGARLVIVPCPANLLSGKKDTEDFLEIVKDAEARWGCPTSLVVIDTLSRVLSGGDENSSVDLGTMVRNLDQIRLRTDAHLMIVHHAGKDQARGARGHSLLQAATDTELAIADKKMRVSKQRDIDPMDEIGFALDGVAIGDDADGDKVTSCVVRWLTAEEFNQTVPLEPGSGAERMWLAFRDAADKKAGVDGDWRDQSITTREWSDAYLERLKTEKGYRPEYRSDGQSKQRLYGLRRDVTIHGYVRKVEGNQWVVN